MDIQKARYVVGFAFDGLKDRVILIAKDHPDWQKGKWNGIGGHIEEGETPLQAMEREGREEAAIRCRWHHYATMIGDDFECFCFCGKTDDDPKDFADSGEFVSWRFLPLTGERIGNLDFLIEAAKICHSFKHIEITYGANGAHYTRTGRGRQ